MHVIADRQTVNDSSAWSGVVQELSALLLAAISSVIETIGGGAPGDDGLTSGVARLTGSANDFIRDLLARLLHDSLPYERAIDDGRIELRRIDAQ